MTTLREAARDTKLIYIRLFVNKLLTAHMQEQFVDKYMHVCYNFMLGYFIG